MSKLKGSVAAIKMKYLLFVFATVMLVALPTRVYQILAIIDPENGFYKSSDVTITVLYVIVFLFVLLFMGMSFLSKEIPSPKLPTGKNPVLGITSAVMVVGLIWDILAIEKSIVPKVGEEFVMERFMVTLKANIADNGGILLVLQFIFAIFAIFYFLVFAISHLNGKGSYKEFKLLALSPLCWSMTVLISKLMKAVSFITESELLFEIFMVVFVMLFFLTFARISSGVFTVDSMWGIYGYGLSACLFAGLVTVPRIAAVLAGREVVVGHEFSFAHFSLLVFIFSYIIASLGVGFKDGIATRRTVTEVELPEDDEVVLKKETPDAVIDETVDFFGEEDIFEEAFEEESVIEETVEAVVEIEDAVEIEPEIEEAVEETVEIEENVEELIEDEAEMEYAEEFIDDESEVTETVDGFIEEDPVFEENVEIFAEEEATTEEAVIEDDEQEPELEETEEEPTEAELEEEISSDASPRQEESVSASDKIKKVFGLGKKSLEPEVIKPLSLADLRKNKEE